MDQQVVSAIERWIDEHTEEYIADVQAFCRIPSVSRADLAQPNAPFGPDCRKALDWALERSAQLGFAVVDHEGYCGTARWGDQDNAFGILGHIDVVPEGEGWIYPPYGATRAGDFLIGRGVSDDKGPALVGLYAARCIRDLGLPMKHGVRVYYGCSEETGMEDLQYYLRHDEPPKLSLVPDCGFPVCIAQKGSLGGDVSIPAGQSIRALRAGLVANMVPADAWAELAVDAEAMRMALAGLGVAKEDFTIEPLKDGCVVRAHGVASHAADPAKGRSALRMLADALARSGLLEAESAKAMAAVAALTAGCYGESCGLEKEDEVSGKTTTNFGLASLKDGRVFVNLDARLSIADDPDDAEARYTAATGALGFSWHPDHKTNPFQIGADSPETTALMNVYREVTGRDDQPYAMGGGTYSRYLSTAISYGVGLPGVTDRPDIPESHGGAHKCDEYAHIPSLLQAMKIYVLALLRLDESVA
ncbi:MAG: Sapep family Mn(2+)-dependent dipeptidase [Clostridia bacterium]|nr:Sapep family Mn(2+)-dependent dipeptidase [Clostridia bacterium]